MIAFEMTPTPVVFFHDHDGVGSPNGALPKPFRVGELWLGEKEFPAQFLELRRRVPLGEVFTIIQEMNLESRQALLEQGCSCRG